MWCPTPLSSRSYLASKWTLGHEALSFRDTSVPKCSKLVKNGSVYAAANSRHLWRTRPGGSAVWGGRPMNREWREGILGTISGHNRWILVADRDTNPPNQLHWHCSGCRVTTLGDTCNTGLVSGGREASELALTWGGIFWHISGARVGFWSLLTPHPALRLNYCGTLGQCGLWGREANNDKGKMLTNFETNIHQHDSWGEEKPLALSIQILNHSSSTYSSSHAAMPLIYLDRPWDCIHVCKSSTSSAWLLTLDDIRIYSGT